MFLGKLYKQPEGGLKEQFTPFYRSQSTEDHPEKSSGRCGCFSIILAVILVPTSVALIVIGSLHAAPLPPEIDEAGVVKQNCTLLEDCGCPGEPMLPWFLIFGGCIFLALYLGLILLSLVCDGCVRKQRGSKGTKACNICNFSCLS